MRVLGKYSVSTAIRLLLTVALCFQILGIGLPVLLYISKPSMARHLMHHIPVLLEKGQKIENLKSDAPTEYNNLRLRIRKGTLSFSSPTRFEMLVYGYAKLVIGFAISISITEILIRIFRSLEQNNPFTRQNAHRLRNISLLVITFFILNFIREYFISWYIQEHFFIANNTIKKDFTPDFTIFLLGILLLIFAEIFRIGAQLKEEQDLTV